MNKTELTAEEIEAVLEHVADMSAGAYKAVPVSTIRELCDMALRATKAEEEAEKLKRALDVVPGTPTPEQLAWAQSEADKADLPEDLAGVVTGLRSVWGHTSDEDQLLDKAADTIEALNAARVKAEGEVKRLKAQHYEHPWQVNENTHLKASRDALEREALGVAQRLRRDLMIEKSHSDAEYRKREAAEAREAALVKALEAIVDVADGAIWIDDAGEPMLDIAREALRTARDAALSPDEAYPGQFEQLDALFSEPPPSEAELERIKEHRRKIEEGLRRAGHQADQEEQPSPTPDAPPIDPVTVEGVTSAILAVIHEHGCYIEGRDAFPSSELGEAAIRSLRLRDKLTKGRAALGGEPE